MDLATTYTLTTGGGTVVFNNGDLKDGTDKFWIQNLPGLDGPDIRAPMDNVPFGHGTLLHSFFKAGIQFAVEGVLLVESVGRNTTECIAVLNEMEKDLRTALHSIVGTAGTLSWTPTGQSTINLAVRYHGQPKLAFQPIDDYANRSFVFGLVSASPLF